MTLVCLYINVFSESSSSLILYLLDYFYAAPWFTLFQLTNLCRLSCLRCGYFHVCLWILSFTSMHISCGPNIQGQRGDVSKRNIHLNEVLLNRVKTVEPRTAWEEKEMSSTINCLMIDLTQWLIIPGTSFHWSISDKHWSMVKTSKACSSLSDKSIFARVGARCKLMVSMVSWLRVKSHRGNEGHAPLLIFQYQNHTNIAVMYQTSSSCLIFANSVHHGGSIILWALKHIQGITWDRSGLVYLTNGASL